MSLILSLLPLSVFATTEETPFIISEIYSNADTSAGEVEWIELHSQSVNAQDLFGFTIWDDKSLIYTIPNGITIDSREYLVIKGWKDKLNNTGDSAIVKDPNGKVVAAEISFPSLAKGESWYPKYQQKGLPTPAKPHPNDDISDHQNTDGDGTPQEETPGESDEEESETSPRWTTADLHISEIYSKPDAGEEEWVEIASTSEGAIDMSGFILADAIRDIYTIPADSILAPGAFLVFSGWGNKLNDTGDSVILKLPDGDEVDAVRDFPALEKNESWLPVESTSGVPTRGFENKILATEAEEDSLPEDETLSMPIAAHGDVVINEIMSNPVEGGEWIELYSLTDKEISLAGLELHDATGRFFVFDNTFLLAAGEFLIVSGWSDKLNNDGDTLTLIGEVNKAGEAGEVIDGPVQIPAVKKGKSYSVDISEITLPTPTEPNLAPNSGEEEALETDQEIFVEEHGDIAVIINEVYPSPANGEAEWVEIFSRAESTINISGFTLSDEQGVIFTFPTETIISPGEFVVASGWSGKLNNGGDTVYLATPGSTVMSQTNYPSIASEKSWGFDGTMYRRTADPTRAAENTFAAEGTSGGGSSGTSSKTEKNAIPTLLKTASAQRSTNKDDFDLQISEVVFSGTPDFVELYCQDCDTDLAGVRVGDDSAFFEFPLDSIVKTGERVVISFAEKAEDARYENGVWYFWANKKGLTASDETIFVVDSYGQVEDAVCIANQNGSFSPGEQEDVVLLIKQGVLRAEHPLTEEYCYDSRKLTKGKALVRGKHHSGFAHLDFFASNTPSPGRTNPPAPSSADDVDLKIENVLKLNSELVIVSIVNQSDTEISVQDFALSSENLTPIVLRAERLTAGKKMFVPLEHAATESIVELALQDHWGNIEDNWQMEFSEPKDGKTGMIISEVLANPKGIDSGNEFVELQCLERICPRESFVLQIGEKVLMVPPNDLQKGEFALVTDIIIKNSNLKIDLIDISAGTKQNISLAHTKDGLSYAAFGNSYFWTTQPTKSAKNILLGEQANDDTDQDGITDAIELALGLDVLIPDNTNSAAMDLYYEYIRKNTELEVEENTDGILIRGKIVPNSKGKIVLHSKQHVYDIVADASGMFRLQIAPDILPGTHTLDLVLEQKQQAWYVLPAVKTIQISRNPREDWLREVKILRVLPNPDGKDKGREYVLLHNPSTQSGWLKQAVLFNGKKKLLLADMFFTPGQTKLLRADQIPTLGNTDGMLSLMSVDGNLLDSLSWKSAKSGQLYWQGMPPAVTKQKKSKVKKPVRSRYATTRTTIEADEITVLKDLTFVRAEAGMIFITNAAGEETSYALAEDISLETLTNSFAEGDKISLIIENGVVQQIYALPPTTIGESIPHKRYTELMLLVTLLAVLGLASSSFIRRLWMSFRQKNPAQIRT